MWEQVLDFEISGHSLKIYRWDTDWLMTNTDNRTGLCRGIVCTCYQDATELVDVCAMNLFGMARA